MEKAVRTSFPLLPSITYGKGDNGCNKINEKLNAQEINRERQRNAKKNIWPEIRK